MHLFSIVLLLAAFTSLDWHPRSQLASIESSPVDSTVRPESRLAPEEILVRWRDGVTNVALQEIHGRLLGELDEPPVTLISVPPGSERRAAAVLKKRDDVVWA